MKGSPFTALCRSLIVLKNPGRADLHTHTTFSDGTHTPTSLVDRAIQAGLKAVAITDHDTTAAIHEARAVSAGRIEVIAGVEITAEFRQHEVHLLGYFVDPDNEPLERGLAKVRQGRRERFLEIARRTGLLDASTEEMVAALPGEVSLGRRHLARLLIERGRVRNLHEAFTRILSTPSVRDIPKLRLDADVAISLIRAAGGVCSWAHPPESADHVAIEELRSLGMQAIECEYPWPTRAHGRRLRELAESLGLAVTGGSDSHDPGPRAIGMRSITIEEVDRIRQLANP